MGVIVAVVSAGVMAYSFFRIGYQQGSDDTNNEIARELAKLAMESHKRDLELAKMEALIVNLKNNLYAEGRNVKD